MVESDYDPDAAPGLLTPPVTWQVSSSVGSSAKTSCHVQNYSRNLIRRCRPPMTKPRLLVPMSLQFSVRYLLRSGLAAADSGICAARHFAGLGRRNLEKELRQQRV